MRTRKQCKTISRAAVVHFTKGWAVRDIASISCCYKAKSLNLNLNKLLLKWNGSVYTALLLGLRLVGLFQRLLALTWIPENIYVKWLNLSFFSNVWIRSRIWCWSLADSSTCQYGTNQGIGRIAQPANMAQIKV